MRVSAQYVILDVANTPALDVAYYAILGRNTILDVA
jgi:hypothetical protein